MWNLLNVVNSVLSIKVEIVSGNFNCLNGSNSCSEIVDMLGILNMTPRYSVNEPRLLSSRRGNIFVKMY